jgi:hypothetical protein
VLKRFLSRFLVIGGLALAAAGLFGTTQAMAAPTTASATAANTMQAVSPMDWGPCSPGYSCYYTGYNGTGTGYTALNCGLFDYPGGYDWVKSVYNRGYGTVHLYAYDGAAYTVPIGGTVNIYDGIKYFYIDC